MNAKLDLGQCQESVWDNFRKYQCYKKAKVTRNGKNYCTIHDPEYITRKHKERTDKWEREWAKMKKANQLKSAAPALLEALKLYVLLCGNTAFEVEREGLQQAWEMAQAAIAKAEGK